MKPLITAMALATALVWIAPADADARSRTQRVKKYKQHHVGFYQRPASVGPNGLCQRDTGTPLSQLNFRNKCDTEEFWNRIHGQGRRR